MKLLIIFLLLSITGYSQSGKDNNNLSVQIYFIDGNFEVQNMNTCTSKVEIAFNQDTIIALLEHGERYKFISTEKDFVISARNLTMCEYTDNTEWITCTSVLNALYIKNKIKSKLITKTICNEQNNW